jgi:hypothetical protein
MHAIVIASLVLLVSLFLLYRGIQGMVSMWLDVVCFWGRVAYREPSTIEYKFISAGPKLVWALLGFAGTLGSVIFLAIKIAAIVA